MQIKIPETGGMKVPPVFLWLSLIVTISVLATGCTSQEKTGLLVDRALASGWGRTALLTENFTLFSLFRPHQASASSHQILTVYIEGDGNAWLSPTRPSSDPTPRYATALSLALADPTKGAVGYLGRPCQYISGPRCSTVYWTSHRYGDAVIEALDQALSELKEAAGSDLVELIGWSGGGVLAALLAARRTDVVRLITVAANLDIEYWTEVRRLTPLAGSRNPAEEGARLKSIAQIHVTGGEDTIVPPEIAGNYLRRIGLHSGRSLAVVPGRNHQFDWAADWPRRVTSLRQQMP